ncbi:MAG: lysophospholipid acyltransferase family protein [Candidatus Omnitrophota bacterium]
MFYSFAVALLYFLFKAFFRLKISGQENIPREGALIIASNHVSFFDPVVVGISSPRKLNFMARESLFENKLFAKIITALNTFPVNRDGSDPSAFKTALDKLINQNALLLFPEGTRSPDGSLQAPKKGIGFLVSKSKAKVLPCFIKGTDEAWPKDLSFPRPKPITIHFGKVIDFNGSQLEEELDKKKAYSYIANKVMEAIGELRKDADRSSG